MLLRNDEALRWRLLLADLAEETLDIQVYIWKDDASGDLFLDRIIKAAECEFEYWWMISLLSAETVQLRH